MGRRQEWVRSRWQPCHDVPQGRAAPWPAILRVLGFIPPKAPCVSSGCLSQGCGLDLEACSPECESFEQSMDGAASSLEFAGVTIQATKKAKEYIHNYRNAGKQILQAQHQGQQLRLTLEQLNKLPSSKQERIAPAKASLNDIQQALPTNFQSTRKRDKLQWITGVKSKFEKEILQNNRIESSATLNLLISLSQDM